MDSKYHNLLEPIYRAYALEVESAGPADVETLASRREHYDAGSQRHEHRLHTSVVHRDITVKSRLKQNISVRHYSPTQSYTPDKLTVYLHGGGWVLGNLDTHQQICIDLCHHSGSQVLAVNYRLAPENPYPAALHDCIDAINTISNTDSEPPLHFKSLVLSGDSAGANLATACCLSGELQHSVDGLAMFYPGLGASAESTSFSENEFAPILPLAVLKGFFLAYLGGDENNIDSLNAPLLSGSFDAIPPCYISAAKYDPLLDDAIQFDAKMNKQGRESELSIENGLGHGFLRVRHDSVTAKNAFEKFCTAISDFHTNAACREAK